MFDNNCFDEKEKVKKRKIELQISLFYWVLSPPTKSLNQQ